MPSTLRLLLCLTVLLGSAGSAAAANKFYSSDPNNGEAGDAIRDSASPPSQDASPDSLEGFHEIDDDGLGTVTLNETRIVQRDSTDVGPDEITGIFGPGAFVFIQRGETTFISAPATSNVTGIGGHGPSSTAPGDTAEWGVVSGWTITGVSFCASSPVDICNENGFAHGMTVDAVLPSTTYDLGTWNFDVVGDLESSEYVHRTTNGGLTNVRYTIQGSFHGASLPALPLVGAGALAVALVTVGARTLLGNRK